MGIVNPESCKYGPSAEQRRVIEDAQFLDALTQLDRSGVENLLEEMKAARQELSPEEIERALVAAGFEVDEIHETENKLVR